MNYNNLIFKYHFLKNKISFLKIRCPHYVKFVAHNIGRDEKEVIYQMKESFQEINENIDFYNLFSIIKILPNTISVHTSLGRRVLTLFEEKYFIDITSLDYRCIYFKYFEEEGNLAIIFYNKSDTVIEGSELLLEFLMTSPFIWDKYVISKLNNGIINQNNFYNLHDKNYLNYKNCSFYKMMVHEYCINHKFAKDWIENLQNKYNINYLPVSHNLLNPTQEDLDDFLKNKIIGFRFSTNLESWFNNKIEYKITFYSILSSGNLILDLQIKSSTKSEFFKTEVLRNCLKFIKEFLLDKSIPYPKDINILDPICLVKNKIISNSIEDIIDHFSQSSVSTNKSQEGYESNKSIII